ncbi:MAG: sodium ion-translocating decarboxylase subunit beta [Clostridia bacterium]|nr:sodium ion-translocating decarboxylase subunit beta [Clostridia bacterium]
MDLIETLVSLWESTGIAHSIAHAEWQNYVMIIISFVLFYLAIVKQFEPLLLLPISFGMFIVNIPGAYDILYGTSHGLSDFQIQELIMNGGQTNYGLFHYLEFGVSKVIYPPLIFLGIGAMTDFGPLIANPKSLLIGAAAQLGVFLTFFGAIAFGFEAAQAAAIGIIGGADGPTAIYVTQQLAPELLSAIAIAAYSYMALIPVIQPPIMKLLTTKKERMIKMQQLRPVSKREKIIFPIAVTLVVGLLLPDALPLLGMLMLGNLFKESMVTERLAKTASNELCNIITILLGTIVGTKAMGATFLNFNTILIIVLGLVAFCFGTVGGLLCAKLLNVLSGGKINPLIGSAGVSAVPMAARVSQKVGQEYDPNNYLLMHAMGPNVAGVIGSAVAAGVFLAIF